MAILQKIALVFTIIAKLFNNVSILEKVIYVVVGVCGLINIGLLFTNFED